MNGLETTLLRIGGVPQSTIDELEKAMPAAAALVKLVKDNDVLIQQIIDFANKAQPLLTKALPLLDQAMSEVEAVLPAAQDIIAFLNTKSNDTLTPQEPNLG